MRLGIGSLLSAFSAIPGSSSAAALARLVDVVDQPAALVGLEFLELIDRGTAGARKTLGGLGRYAVGVIGRFQGRTAAFDILVGLGGGAIRTSAAPDGWAWSKRSLRREPSPHRESLRGTLGSSLRQSLQCDRGQFLGAEFKQQVCGQHQSAQPLATSCSAAATIGKPSASRAS